MNKSLLLKLEQLSGIKIRHQKWSKYILKVMNHLNLSEQDLDSTNSYEIITFINSSNSKCHAAYWICRTDLATHEFHPILEQYKTKFMESSYKNTNRKVVGKKFITENKSRGYSGYTTIRNNQLYCRSKAEFIYLHYLAKKYPECEIKTEDKIFYYLNYSYKPDIFIYLNNKLIKIVEIKSSVVETYHDKYNQAKIYFDSIGIQYEILSDPRRILKLYPEINTKLIEWIKTCAHINKSVSGENNPRYGTKCSDETKKKISEKAKSRFNNPEYRKKISDSIKERYIIDPGYRKKISAAAIERGKTRREMNKILYEKNHKFCHWCGKKIEYENKNRKTCSPECCIKLSNSHKIYDKKKTSLAARHSYKNQIIKYLDLIKKKYNIVYTDPLFNTIVQLAKQEKLVPKHFGLTIQTIKKYLNEN